MDATEPAGRGTVHSQIMDWFEANIRHKFQLISYSMYCYHLLLRICISLAAMREMANYDESDEDIFITQSSYSNCSPIGSDTDEVLNDVLELEASKYVKGSSSFLAEISSEDDELLSSTLKAEREFSGNRQEAEESRFGSPLAAKDLEKIVENAKCKNTENKARWAVGVFCKWQEARSKCEQILSKKSLIAMTKQELSESLLFHC